LAADFASPRLRCRSRKADEFRRLTALAILDGMLFRSPFVSQHLAEANAKAAAGPPAVVSRHSAASHFSRGGLRPSVRRGGITLGSFCLSPNR
jgi:hypothetical protein